jgi:hypothetical protein
MFSRTKNEVLTFWTARRATFRGLPEARLSPKGKKKCGFPTRAGPVTTRNNSSYIRLLCTGEPQDLEMMAQRKETLASLL